MRVRWSESSTSWTPPELGGKENEPRGAPCDFRTRIALLAGQRLTAPTGPGGLRFSACDVGLVRLCTCATLCAFARNVERRHTHRRRLLGLVLVQLVEPGRGLGTRDDAGDIRIFVPGAGQRGRLAGLG